MKDILRVNSTFRVKKRIPQSFIQSERVSPSHSFISSIKDQPNGVLYNQLGNQNFLISNGGHKSFLEMQRSQGSTTSSQVQKDWKGNFQIQNSISNPQQNSLVNGQIQENKQDFRTINYFSNTPKTAAKSKIVRKIRSIGNSKAMIQNLFSGQSSLEATQILNQTNQMDSLIADKSTPSSLIANRLNQTGNRTIQFEGQQ